MKRFLLILSLVLSVFSLCLFAACGETNNPSGNEGSTGNNGEVEQKCKHTWGKWEDVTPAKCEETGTRKRVCSLCGAEDIQPTPALNHLFSDEYTVDEEAQCNKLGKESRHCLRAGCNATTDERDIPMSDHDWVPSGKVIEPTCTKDGVAEGATCSFCGATQENTPIPKLGHNFDNTISANVEITSYPTCTSNGEALVKCTRCDERDRQIIPSPGHDWEIQSQGEENECGGRVCTLKCATCGKTKTETVGGNKHEWSAYVYVSGAKCSAYGVTEKRVCSKCEAEDVRTTKLENARHSRGLDGDPDYFYVLKEATEGQDGTVCELCTACGEVILETAQVIPMLSTVEKVTYSVHIVHDNYLSDSFEKECEVSVYDGNTLVEKKTTEEMIANFELDKKEYTVKISNLPTGFTAEESYALTPGKPFLNAYLKGTLQTSGTPDRGYYQQGDIAREFTFHDYDNKEYKISDLLKTHKLVVFDYFFTTCSFCLTAFAYEKDLKLHDRFPDIAFVYVNTKNESKEEVMKLAEKYNFADAILVNGLDGANENNLMHAFAPRDSQGVEEEMGNPTRVIIDNEGVVTRIVRSDAGGSMPDTYVYILRNMVVLKEGLFYPVIVEGQDDDTTTGE